MAREILGPPSCINPRSIRSQLFEVANEYSDFWESVSIEYSIDLSPPLSNDYWGWCGRTVPMSNLQNSS